jgi:hypothetical protein
MVARKDALGITSGFTTVRPNIGMKETYERWHGAAVVRQFCGCSETFDPTPGAVVIRGRRGPSPLGFSERHRSLTRVTGRLAPMWRSWPTSPLGAEGGHVEDGTVIR